MKHGTWKSAPGKGDSYWIPSFSGSMLNFGRVYDLYGLHHFPASRMPCSTSCCTSNSLRSPSSFVSNISNLSCSASESGSGPNWQQWDRSRPKAQRQNIPQPKAENRKPKAENPRPKAKSPDTRREHGRRMIRSYLNPTSPPWWMSTEVRTHSSPVDERWTTHARQSQAQKADYPNLKPGSRKPEANSKHLKRTRTEEAGWSRTGNFGKRCVAIRPWPFHALVEGKRGEIAKNVCRTGRHGGGTNMWIWLRAWNWPRTFLSGAWNDSGPLWAQNGALVGQICVSSACCLKMTPNQGCLDTTPPPFWRDEGLPLSISVSQGSGCQW